MRITNNMLINNMTYNLNGTLQRLERLQYETSVGKKFRVPSDDPIAASKSLKFNTDISKVEQYIRNSKDAQSWMKDTESALKEIKAILHRANELSVQAANGTNTDDLDKIKDEIAELKGHLIQVGNSTYAGRSLFTGYKTDKKLLNPDGTYNIDLEKDAVTGKEEIFEYNVGVAETVKINILGNKVFGKATYTTTDPVSDITGGPGYGDNITGGNTPYLVAIFSQLEDALESKDTDKLQKAIGNIEGAMNNVLSVTAEIGAKMNRLELTQNKLEDQVISLKELLSFNEDVSLPEAYMKLAIEENVYRASLSVGGRIIQPSLMDFLR
ncbi:flagellar hook-associated protein FlgL [Tissierella pigra]|uniref:flagellar hook-associated protein FlgL n=1 Tax=Tissierella pigra TaxID=2607614 RepID=UPI001C1174BA|nr:flagellar hook-associated protein FlgL [Tissierella pigra]MBU5427811.1 flagellar hook-associated protein FlgL [Tissierella pigra]